MMLLTGNDKFMSNSDIIILSENINSGYLITNEISKININTINTFLLDNNKSRSQKMASYMGDSRIKATTFHSFKGL